MVDDHEDYLPGETPAAHKTTHQNGGADEISVAGLAGETAELAAHKILPTVHQDAPALILTHKGDASAHHAKYTDAEARVLQSPLSIPPASFITQADTNNYLLDEYYLKNRTALTQQYFYTGLIVPNGVTITKLSIYGYRDDVNSVMSIALFRMDRAGTRVVMASITATWSTGYSSLYDDSITSPVINNVDYNYVLRAMLDPNDSVNDVKFTGTKIDFTG